MSVVRLKGSVTGLCMGLSAMVAIATITFLPSPSFASDTEYLQTLDQLVSDEPLIKDIVGQLGATNNIRMAKGVCTLLDNPSVKTIEDLVSGVIAEEFFGLPTPNLPSNSDDRATAVGGYIAATTFAGIPAYCDRNLTKVQAMFRALMQ